jgi:hypothetical protein
MDAQERIGAQGGAKAPVLVQRRVSPLKLQPWPAWVVILLSWVALFVVLLLIFRATGCNRSSEARVSSRRQSRDVVAESVSFEARSKNGPFAAGVARSSQPLSRNRFRVLNGETRPLVTVPGYPRRDSWLGGRLVEVKEILWKEQRL